MEKRRSELLTVEDGLDDKGHDVLDSIMADALQDLNVFVGERRHASRARGAVDRLGCTGAAAQRLIKGSCAPRGAGCKGFALRATPPERFTSGAMRLGRNLLVHGLGPCMQG